ncbi:Uncharacterised protein [Amycolatopsis camponoti]|uniref:FAD-binding domain-containing protein n=1 Tax=Amycolatopsis camponoti TaxID=2606593 RepID=A0A6I8M0U4_9PSEU|nr:Uncharacterised protein [Amycolatopsis camponoti]
MEVMRELTDPRHGLHDHAAAMRILETVAWSDDADDSGGPRRHRALPGRRPLLARANRPCPPCPAPRRRSPLRRHALCAKTPTTTSPIIGYGPTGVTATNLLGAQGLKVIVVERDAAVHARATYTDEEVLHIRQQVGLAEELQCDIPAGLPIDFVDHRGPSFLSPPSTRQPRLPTPAIPLRGRHGRDPRQGVARFPNAELLRAHECLRVRASWVIAADGCADASRTRTG